MRFRVHHVTTYRYSQPVRLGPHWLRPRSDGGVALGAFELEIQPPPVGRSDSLDVEGNLVTRVWFAGETTHFSVSSRFDAHTLLADPCDYLSEPAPWEQVYAPAPAARLAPWIAQDAGTPAPTPPHSCIG